LREAIECVINGDLTTGKAELRDYVNATLGFQDLEKRTHIPAKSLMRMLGPKGSPSAENLSTILTALQRKEGVRFSVSTSDLAGIEECRHQRIDPLTISTRSG
jgi:DNA-binding phage protein